MSEELAAEIGGCRVDIIEHPQPGHYVGDERYCVADDARLGPRCPGCAGCPSPRISPGQTP